jgi:dynein intermediate chain, cytosolic
MPVQRSGISADSHKYPVCGLNVVGTQIANNIVSFSNDGMMCMWDVKQFSKPTRTNRLAALRPVRQTSKVLPPSVNRSSALYRNEDSVISKTSSILEKTVKDELHDINITCSGFPSGDANNYYLGSLNGVLYKGSLHNKGNEKMALFDEHNGPISGLSVNNQSEFDYLNGLVLTSSYDWTVKLWNPENKDAVRTFESSEDYIYDVAWHPTNPSLFTTVNNDGYLDVFDLTRNVELPIAQEKVGRNGLNKCKWNNDGSAIVTGDSSGSISMYILAEKYRRMDPSKYEDLTKYLVQAP